MTSAHGDLLPPEFGRWPRKVQRQYIQELYALYFPGEALSAATPQPGDDDVVEAEIVDDDAGPGEGS